MKDDARAASASTDRLDGRRSHRSDDQIPGLPWRRQVLTVLLAVATAVTVVLTLLDPPGGVKRTPRPPPPDAAVCAPGQTQGCVGGQAQIIVPPRPSASAAVSPR
ncbi:MAG: hypothetical protein LH480_11885 [Rubrivivax sp.]|nr:hypothetical protein [Rubrivivax sp.]